MKPTVIAEAYIISSDKKRKDPIKLEFQRIGVKGGRKTKEFFWINRTGALTLEDLKAIASEAEKLIKVADGAEASEL